MDNNFIFLQSNIQQESAVREAAIKYVINSLQTESSIREIVVENLQEKLKGVKTISNFENTIFYLDFESPFLGRNKGCLPVNGDIAMVAYRNQAVNSIPPQTLKECIDNYSLYGTRSWSGGIVSYADKQVDWSVFTEEFIFKFNVVPGTYQKEIYFGKVQASNVSATIMSDGFAYFDNKWWVISRVGGLSGTEIVYNDVTNLMPTITPGEWYHYAYQKENDTDFSVYFNGKKLGTWTNITTNASVNVQPIPSGTSQFAGSNDTGLFKKLISVDQYRVTAQALYNSNFTPSKFE